MAEGEPLHGRDMTRNIPKPLEGKTYSLHGSHPGSEAYYALIHAVADDLIAQHPDISHLIEVVRHASKNKRRLKKLAAKISNGSLEWFLLRTLRERFSQHTTNVALHLRDLSLAQRWDRTIATSEEQYLFHMLEIELVNRLCLNEFRRCDSRLAFLPHCLKDLSADCQSAHHGEDYTCKACSKDCTINAVSRLLRHNRVTPYIWMTANLHSLFRKLQKEGKTVGVLGIACIPELVRGMRLCMRGNVPVIGIPLDANRCARWWGEFYPNSVNMPELERLMDSGVRGRERANAGIDIGLQNS